MLEEHQQLDWISRQESENSMWAEDEFQIRQMAVWAAAQKCWPVPVYVGFLRYLPYKGDSDAPLPREIPMTQLAIRLYPGIRGAERVLLAEKIIRDAMERRG